MSELNMHTFFTNYNPDLFACHRLHFDGNGNPVDSDFMDINRSFENYSGLARADIVGKKGKELSALGHIFKFDWLGAYCRLAEAGGSVCLEYYAEDTGCWYDVTVYTAQPQLMVTVFRDITGKKAVERRLCESEARLKSIFRVAPVGIGLISHPDRVLLQVNQKFCELTGYRMDELVGQSALVLYATKEEFASAGEEKSVQLKAQSSANMEIKLKRKDGKTIDVLLNSSPVDPENLKEGITFTALDITERKSYEAQLKYLSLHDPLTGLYNRAYCENELQRLEGGREYPVAIVAADLDGLKLVNDILGHREGDRIIRVCAQVLKNSLRKTDILARVSGDEFVLLMPRTDSAAGEEVIKRIRRGMEQYNLDHPGFPLSISLGMAVSTSDILSLEETYTLADSLMYRDKHYRSEIVRLQIVKALLTSLNERYYTTETCAEQLKELCWRLGNEAGLNMHQQTDLALLALVHDLGMVGIPEQLLLKEEMTEQETEVMRQHPKKGYRIACSSPDLSSVADLILRHEECWDGSGYPLGLKGEDIPIECRILSIVLAYDSMIGSPPRGRFKTRQEALASLARYAGERFDPWLVKLFTNLAGG